jgi:hypothetical protein
MDRGAAMTFDEILEQVITLLQRQKRVAYEEATRLTRLIEIREAKR